MSKPLGYMDHYINKGSESLINELVANERYFDSLSN